MGDWEKFPDMDEKSQAIFLLSVAKKSLDFIVSDFQIRSKILNYIHIADSVMDNNFEKINELAIFLNDPNMENDFNNFYEILKKNEKESAALDIISYACGFICRYAAKFYNKTNLSDPIVESVPDIYEYYKGKAEFLNI